MLADLILESNAKLNILGANTEDIGGSAYGQMLIEKPDQETLERVKNYLDKKKMSYEEVEVDRA